MFPDLEIGTEFVLSVGQDDYNIVGDMILVIDSVVVNVNRNVAEWHWDIRPKYKSWFEKTSFYDSQIREAIQNSPD